MNNLHSRPKVVITGLGAVTPLGSNIQKFWEGLVNGRSGIRRISQFDASELPCQIAGEIPDFEPLDYFSKKDARRTPRSTQIALAAAVQAVSDAGLPDLMPVPERSSVVFGTAIGGFDFVEEGISSFRSGGYSRAKPYVLPNAIPNLPAFTIARCFQCLGPNSTITTACATGTQAIGEAAEYIRRGSADIVLCGGTEALITDFIIAGFSVIRAMPFNYNDNPSQASRPFDRKREGFVFSEGAAVLVLEEFDHALARDAHIYAELSGFASSSDAYHIAAPNPDASGPRRTMRWAVQDAGISGAHIDYINAHGTSTILNDATETKAIKELFKDRAYEIPISSVKSMIGHPMGGSGAIEAAATALSVYHGLVPPTINYEFPDPECDLDYVPNKSRQLEIQYALSNSFGLGGQNACLVFKRYERGNAMNQNLKNFSNTGMQYEDLS